MPNDAQLQLEFVTERLLLTELQESDADFIIQLLNTKGWLEFIGDRNVHAHEDAIGYIQKIQRTANFNYWVVRLRATGESIGLVTFLKRSYLEHFDIGFAFLPEYGGYGYAYEAAKEVMDMLKQHPDYNPILATTVPNNVLSIKLLTKLGLRFEREIEVGNEKLHIYTDEK